MHIFVSFGGGYQPGDDAILARLARCASQGDHVVWDLRRDNFGADREGICLQVEGQRAGVEEIGLEHALAGAGGG